MCDQPTTSLLHSHSPHATEGCHTFFMGNVSYQFLLFSLILQRSFSLRGCVTTPNIKQRSSNDNGNVMEAKIKYWIIMEGMVIMSYLIIVFFSSMVTFILDPWFSMIESLRICESQPGSGNDILNMLFLTTRLNFHVTESWSGWMTTPMAWHVISHNEVWLPCFQCQCQSHWWKLLLVFMKITVAN